MTDQEKIMRHDALEHLREKISGCFGDMDGIFAGHPFDEERAKELRELAAKNHISLREVWEIAIGYLLYDRGYVWEHVNKQMGKVTKFFKTKLS